MSDLPKRVPGAQLQQTDPPPGGWFGPQIEWPHVDLDKGSSVFAHYFSMSRPFEDPDARELCDHVLVGLRQLGAKQNGAHR
jgi:hypothetical protein